MVYIPRIDRDTAKEISQRYDEEHLLRAIAYLELVIDGKIRPGNEMKRLGIDARGYSIQELNAVQNRLALAIYLQRENSTSLLIPIKIRRVA